ncbi:MAG: hypothetical protein JSR99_01200 [Proteobacteria bacterium]|nr:hypothetical protein [Pseudomonadota bacterium]
MILSMMFGFVAMDRVRALGHPFLAYSQSALLLATAMIGPMLIVSAFMAAMSYEIFGLKALTRYWVNLQWGWAIMFIAMGGLGLIPLHGGMDMRSMPALQVLTHPV